MITFDKDDIFNLGQDHPKWKAVFSAVRKCQLGAPEVMKARVEMFNSMLRVTAGKVYAVY